MYKLEIRKMLTDLKDNLDSLSILRCLQTDSAVLFVIIYLFVQKA